MPSQSLNRGSFIRQEITILSDDLLANVPQPLGCRSAGFGRLVFTVFVFRTGRHMHGLYGTACRSSGGIAGGVWAGVGIAGPSSRAMDQLRPGLPLMLGHCGPAPRRWWCDWVGGKATVACLGVGVCPRCDAPPALGALLPWRLWPSGAADWRGCSVPCPFERSDRIEIGRSGCPGPARGVVGLDRRGGFSQV